MRNLFKKEYSVDDLKNYKSTLKSNRDITRIAMVDDKKIRVIQKLQNNNFNIKHFYDVSDIKDLEPYDIVITDIDGVGLKLGAKEYGGTHIISEVSINFPLKYIISYSSNGHNLSLTKFFNICDASLDKQSDIYEWIACLDKGIKNISNPIYIWKKKIREKLEKDNISVKHIREIENLYVKSILKNNSSYFNQKSWSKSLNYSDAVNTISAINSFLQIIINAG